MPGEQKITARIESPHTNLYDLGYLSIDLYQLVVAGELIESDNSYLLDRYFLYPRGPITRYTEILRYYKDLSPRLEVRSGSIELILAGAALVTSIIMPIVSIKISHALARRDDAVQFQVSVEDRGVKQILDAYEVGEFGSGVEAIEMLFAILRQRNYDVRVNGKDIYAIEHITNRYSKRMVRTIRKYGG